ncbi:MAG TPA: CDP-alcohol phosphatidyltransferase family protein [Candidatus Acidoferrales bacterium]|nr:CDP-alcohol phosphatidyltransferase family protein [Candidatus Acidoferrales bacterium]
MPGWLNLANIITIFRLVMTPFIVRDILEGRHTRALLLFCLAALTDAIDGWVARASGTTQAGAYLDPVADKCLMSGIFLALGAARFVPWWFVAIVFGRDLYLLLATLAMLALTRRRKFPPSRWGKLSTFVQIATAVTWMTRNVWPLPGLASIASAMLWACAAFTVWSGVHYTAKGVAALRTH